MVACRSNACVYGTYGFDRKDKSQSTVKALMNEGYTEEQNRDLYWYKNELERLQPQVAEKSQDLDFMEDYAFLLYRTARTAESEKVYRQILAKEPDRFSALAAYGTLLHHLNRFDEAAQSIGKAAAQKPEFRNGAEKLHLRMIEFQKQQRLSREYSEKHLFLDEFTPLWNMRKPPPEGFAKVEFPELDADALAELLRQFPKFGDGWLILGMLLQKDDDHPRALRAYQLAIKHATSHRQEVGDYVKRYTEYARAQDPARTGARRLVYLVIFGGALLILFFVVKFARSIILDVTAARSEKQEAERRAQKIADKKDGVL